MKPSKYIERDEFILKIVNGKTVLHLGCICFSHIDMKKRISRFEDNLHNKLLRISDVVGVDNDKETIMQLRASGYCDNIIVGDVEQLELVSINRQFEIILAGDIIEHLSNCGAMLQGIKKLCTQETLIIITTPNSFGIINFVRYVFNRFCEESGHVLSFNIENLRNLLNRYNYDIIDYYTGFQDYTKLQHNKVFMAIGKFFLRIFPKYGGTLIVICKIRTT